MLRLVVVVSLLAGCRISLETEESIVGRRCQPNPASASCMAAVGHADLTWIQANVFNTSCTFSTCHVASSPNEAGQLDLTSGRSHAELLGIASRLEPSRMLVAPNDVQSSYLMLMLGDYGPDEATPAADPPEVGYMPLGAPALCCEKLDAIEQWIEAGAPNN
jgi:hypothetical protein